MCIPNGQPNNGSCNCSPTYATATCAVQCPGGYLNCSGNGNCLDGAANNGTCTCNPGFWALNCANACNCASNSSGCDQLKGCLCQPTFYGRYCNNVCPGTINSNTTCSGYGTCDDGSTGTGECTCVPFYFGANCSQACPINIDSDAYCSNQSCFDGATGSGNCNCSPGFYGTYCQLQCPSTNGSICNGQGTCSDGYNGTGQCTCDGKYWGPTCSNECLPIGQVKCSGYGLCSQNNGSCICFEGYWGVTCNNTCPGGTNACFGNAVIPNCNSDGTCTCKSGYYGSSCSSECLPNAPNACNSLTDQGRCMDGAKGSGQCQCFGKFYGPICENECICNFGDCLPDANGTLRCASCYPGYFNANCSEACPGTPPCSGHGTCNDGLAGNGTCSCSVDYTASDCSVFETPSTNTGGDADLVVIVAVGGVGIFALALSTVLFFWFKRRLATETANSTAPSQEIYLDEKSTVRSNGPVEIELDEAPPTPPEGSVASGESKPGEYKDILQELNRRKKIAKLEEDSTAKQVVF
jgi:hypothetical protein